MNWKAFNNLSKEILAMLNKFIKLVGIIVAILLVGIFVLAILAGMIALPFFLVSHISNGIIKECGYFICFLFGFAELVAAILVVCSGVKILKI